MRTRILFLIAALITYGSLYPFNFALPASHAAAWDRLLYDWSPFTSRGDALGNFALFVPFGFAGVFTAGNRIRTAPGIPEILVLSFVLAIALQMAQIYFPPRTPAIADVVWNMMGAGLGVLGGWYLRGRIQMRPHSWQDAHAIPAALLVLWLAAELLPFVPSLDLQAIKNSAKTVLRLNLSPFDILWHFAGALVAGRALKAIFGSQRAVQLLGVLIAAVVAGKVLVVTRLLNASTLAGLAAGYAVSRFAWNAQRPLRGESLIPVIVLAAYTLKALEPYALREAPAEFMWVPFAAMLRGSMLINAEVLVESAFAFAAILGLIRMQGSPIGASMVVLACWVAALEAVQMYLVGRVPDITEPLLVLLVGQLLRSAPAAAPRHAARR